ncbi:MAG: hypothetical protein IID30_09075 [Planctomycetes bacterium]|nr:hypothetical protein [Planctomycetota bacterium]MCH7601943.1 hypothetical protein [Planctomycetota bacterium]
MTSAQSMQPECRWKDLLTGRIMSAFVLSAMLLVFSGCSYKRLHVPLKLSSPYPQPQLWAVAPFGNESGVSLVETYRISDMFTEQVQQVQGLDSIPVNRVIEAMRHLGLERVETTRDASTLMRVLGVDALIVGTVTAYDPYLPPKLGIAIQLFHNDARASYSDLDPRALTRAPTDQSVPGASKPIKPIAQAAGVFEASNHETLKWLKEYARGRTLPDSAYGSDIYLVSMELYTQFVSFRLTHDLLAFERSRLSPEEEPESMR